MGKMDEIIIVTPRETLFDNERLVFQGVSNDEDLIKEVMSNLESNFSEMRRGDAEENKSFKQPIPYAVMKIEDELFVYERLKGAGETRLHSKLSMGVGGHMNMNPAKTNATFDDLTLFNITREVNEELNVDGNVENIKTVGIINDDSDEVGEVHLGLLIVIELSKGAKITVNEVDQLKGSMMKLSDIAKGTDNYERLENWSKLVVDYLS